MCECECVCGGGGDREIVCNFIQVVSRLATKLGCCFSTKCCSASMQSST